jgi:hypothetical protein
MGQTLQLPHRVGRIVERYRGELDAAGVDIVQGLYLVGSVALGDYQEQSSGVDFIAVTSGPMTPALAEMLARIHARLRTGKRPGFDGVYLERDRLCRLPGPGEIADYAHDGTFHTAHPCADVNPATFQCLAQSGIVVFGPAVADLEIATDVAGLRRFEMDHLHGYWARWVARSDAALQRMDHDANIEAAPLGWGVLGLLRVGYTIETGRIVSKTDAGRWALGRYPLKFRNVIEEALAVRRGEAPMLTRARVGITIDFMRAVLAAYPRAATLDA